MQNLNDILIKAAGNTPATPETTPQEPEVTEPETNVQDTPTTNEPEVTTPEVNPDTTPDPETDTGAKAKSNPMKEVRDRLNKEQKVREHMEKTIQRFTEGSYNFKIRDFKTEDGKVDYDALQKAMDEADVKTRAESKGVSPEVQAEIERIEQEKLNLQKEKLRVAMDRELSNLQVDKQLSKEDINKFFKDSLALNRNPYQWLAQGGELDDLYFLIYKDALIKSEVDKAVAEAKAKWEESNSKKSPTPNPATPAQTTHNPDGLSLSTLLTNALKK